MNVTATAVHAEPVGMNFVEVSIDGVADEDYLESIDPKIAVEYYGEDTLLDIIGQDAVIEHFNL